MTKNQFTTFNSNKKEIVPINCHDCKSYDIIPCVLVPDLEIMFVCNNCDCQFKVTELETISKIDTHKEEKINLMKDIKDYFSRLISTDRG